jgi:hypothetical protein
VALVDPLPACFLPLCPHKATRQEKTGGEAGGEAGEGEEGKDKEKEEQGKEREKEPREGVQAAWFEHENIGYVLPALPFPSSLLPCPSSYAFLPLSPSPFLLPCSLSLVLPCSPLFFIHPLSLSSPPFILLLTLPRSDKVTLFASVLPPGTYTYSYIARATKKGKFHVFPTKVEEMYSPEIFGHSSMLTLVVHEDEEEGGKPRVMKEGVVEEEEEEGEGGEGDVLALVEGKERKKRRREGETEEERVERRRRHKEKREKRERRQKEKEHKGTKEELKEVEGQTSTEVGESQEQEKEGEGKEKEGEEKKEEGEGKEEGEEKEGEEEEGESSSFASSSD